jgi:hypothetical protein
VAFSDSAITFELGSSTMLQAAREGMDSRVVVGLTGLALGASERSYDEGPMARGGPT